MENLQPITRQEKIIAGEDIQPITRMEYFLKEYGSGGGLSIKTITFTDRPTLYAWLQNNASRVLKGFLLSNQSTLPMVFSQFVAYDNGAYEFQRFIPSVTTTGDTKTLEMRASYASVEADRITITDVSTMGTTDEITTVIPDEYWIPMGAEFTIYYIE